MTEATQNSTEAAAPTQSAETTTTTPSATSGTSEQPASTAQPAQDAAKEAAQESKPAEKEQLMFAEKKEGAEADKVDGDAKDADKPEDGEAAAEVAYSDFELPKEYVLPDDMKGEFTEFAKEAKLSQEDAQKAVNMHVKMLAKNAEAWNEMKQSWAEESRADPVIGGDKLDTSVANANNMVRKFAENPEFGGSKELFEEFQTDLKELGLGNKRSLIRFLNNIAKASGEDSIAGERSTGGGQQTKSDAEILWPKDKYPMG